MAEPKMKVFKDDDFWHYAYKLNFYIRSNHVKLLKKKVYICNLKNGNFKWFDPIHWIKQSSVRWNFPGKSFAKQIFLILCEQLNLNISSNFHILNILQVGTSCIH